MSPRNDMDDIFDRLRQLEAAARALRARHDRLERLARQFLRAIETNRLPIKGGINHRTLCELLHPQTETTDYATTKPKQAPSGARPETPNRRRWLTEIGLRLPESRRRRRPIDPEF